MSDPSPTGKHLARKPRGFPDQREATLLTQARLVETVTAVYRQWGFEALDTSAFEFADALGKFLPDADRPNAGVFALKDDDEQWMALRYDLTAPLARFVAEAGQSLGRPFRRYAAGPVWRNEKPGPGRFREFWQCDADTIGASGAHADAEMIAMGAAALRAIGMGDGEFVMRVNTRRLLNAALNAVGAQDDSQRLTILRALDKLDRLGVSGVADLLGAGRKDESGDFTKGAGLDAKHASHLLDFVSAGAASRAATLENLGRVCGASEDGAAGLAELEAIARALDALGAPDADVKFDPSIVRGLEYYTGPVFEAELLREVIGEDGRKFRIGSIGGGGRYDDLIARFTGERVPATGFSIGISRLAAALSADQRHEIYDGPVVVLNFDKGNPAIALQLAADLRAAGLRAETYMGDASMKAQMKYADRRRAPVVVIAGEDEIKKGTVTLKDLEAGARSATEIDSHADYRAQRPGQIEVARADLVTSVRRIIEAANA